MAIIVSSSGLPASMAMDLDSRIAFCKRSRFGAACAGSSKVTSCQRFDEVGDLRGVQVLQHEVPELGVAQPLRLDSPRRAT